MSKVSNTFLSNNPVLYKDGEKYFVLETSTRTTEMLVLRLSNDKAYHYDNGVFTPINLDTCRTNGHYFAFGVIHNWVGGEFLSKLVESS